MTGIWQAIIVLAIVCLVGLRLLFLQLPVHMDEYDYLFIGRQLINGESWPSLSYVFGADFNWYLFAWFDLYIDGICSSGICGPRLLALLLGLFSLGACYVFTRSFNGSNRSALLATLMLAVSAPHGFISSIATYDVVSFTLFSWSVALTWLLFNKQAAAQQPSQVPVPGSASPRRYTLLLFIPALATLTAAVLSKYIVLLLLPGMFLLSLLMTPVLALAGAGLLCVLLGAYYLLNRSSLHILIETQLNGVHGTNITRSELAEQFVSFLGLPLLALFVTVALVTVLQLFRQRLGEIPGNPTHAPTAGRSSGKQAGSILILIVLAATLPAYHLLTLNRIAFAKHLVYSYFFILPLLAYLLLQLYDSAKQYFQSALVAKSMIAAFFCLYGMNNAIQLSELKRGYPDTANLVSFWNTSAQINQTTNRILSEDPYLFRYLAGHGFDQARISETTYLDNDLDGQFTEQDIVDALWGRKYQWVLLTDQIHPVQNARYRHILKLRDYRPVFNQPYYLTSTLSGNHHGNVQLFKSY